MTATSPNVPEREVRDRQLAGEIAEMLARDADVNAQDIDVQVQNGMVVLSGTSTTLREKERAGDLAKKARGAVFVENDIVISTDRDIDDGEIASAVADALSNFPDYDPSSVGVRLVEDGVIYLHGSVVSAAEKKQAETIASGVRGVRGIVNEISIAPGTPVDDRTIHNAAMDALSDDPRIDPFDIEVEVRNGDLSLTGVVQDEEARQACTEVASDVPGVKAVFNGLRVRESSG